MRYEIIEMLDAELIREMCINHNYFTKGDNDTYNKMLNKFNHLEVTSENLNKLAEVIYTNSEWGFSFDYTGVLADIMTYILREGVTRFVSRKI